MIWVIFIKILKNIIQIKKEILFLFDCIIADMLSNKKCNSLVTELFTREKSKYFSLLFITKSYFAVSKNIRPNSTHFFVMKI